MMILFHSEHSHDLVDGVKIKITYKGQEREREKKGFLYNNEHIDQLWIRFISGL